ncbi:hypothetical protein CC80DRAFT_19263 [Byssothecium circinans]|uniref:Uncharacterized protein n=1 Tax=Byssothecium circinans TaxID=147558 RepID=A0A6A5UCC7_9PLEO|nr:hypothetical protein CC80DRAFT_19263 [Byssothecium circinans]
MYEDDSELRPVSHGWIARPKHAYVDSPWRPPAIGSPVSGGRASGKVGSVCSADGDACTALRRTSVVCGSAVVMATNASVAMPLLCTVCAPSLSRSHHSHCRASATAAFQSAARRVAPKVERQPPRYRQLRPYCRMRVLHPQGLPCADFGRSFSCRGAEDGGR